MRFYILAIIQVPYSAISSNGFLFVNQLVGIKIQKSNYYLLFRNYSFIHKLYKVITIIYIIIRLCVSKDDD